MPRPLRLEFENACYHVMNRGAGYQDIFKEEQHRVIFLDLLSEVSLVFGVEIFAYCLMDNHYHLLMSTPRANLSRVMRHLNGIYTQRFNRMVKTDGPLFRGRYKAIVVDRDNYLLQVSRYIHLNPVVADLCELPEQYKWSSYSYYLDGSNKPWWLKTDIILSMMSLNNARVAYARYVINGLDIDTELFYRKKKTAVILGTDQFKARLLAGLSEEKIAGSKSDYKQVQSLPNFEEIHQACADLFKMTKTELCRGGRGLKNDFRKIAMYACRVWGSMKLSDIAREYHCSSHGNVCNAVSDVRKRLQTDKALLLLVEGLQNILLHK